MAVNMVCSTNLDFSGFKSNISRSSVYLFIGLASLLNAIPNIGNAEIPQKKVFQLTSSPRNNYESFSLGGIYEPYGQRNIRQQISNDGKVILAYSGRTGGGNGEIPDLRAIQSRQSSTLINNGNITLTTGINARIESLSAIRVSPSGSYALANATSRVTNSELLDTTCFRSGSRYPGSPDKSLTTGICLMLFDLSNPSLTQDINPAALLPNEVVFNSFKFEDVSFAPNSNSLYLVVSYTDYISEFPLIVKRVRSILQYDLTTKSVTTIFSNADSEHLAVGHSGNSNEEFFIDYINDEESIILGTSVVTASNPNKRTDSMVRLNIKTKEWRSLDSFVQTNNSTTYYKGLWTNTDGSRAKFFKDRSYSRTSSKSSLIDWNAKKQISLTCKNKSNRYAGSFTDVSLSRNGNTLTYVDANKLALNEFGDQSSEVGAFNLLSKICSRIGTTKGKTKSGYPSTYTSSHSPIISGDGEIISYIEYSHSRSSENYRDKIYNVKPRDILKKGE